MIYGDQGLTVAASVDNLVDFVKSLSGLVAYYPMNEAAGSTTVVNRAPSTFGSYNISYSSTNVAEAQSGKYGNCFDFDSAGGNYSMDIAATGVLPISKNAAFTISFLMNFGGVAAATIFSEPGAGNTTFYLEPAASAAVWKLLMKWRNDDGSYNVNANSTLTFDDGEWVHIVFRYRAGDIDIFKNGVKEDVNANTKGTFSPTSTFVAERTDLTAPFDGKLQHLALFNVAVSDTNILSMAQWAGLA